jgi:hypothetical protein
VEAALEQIGERELRRSAALTTNATHFAELVARVPR